MSIDACILNSRNSGPRPPVRKGGQWGSATMAKLTKILKLGRSQDCSLTLQDDTVSRTHASLEIMGDGTLDIRDLGSANGTWVRDGRQWRRVDRARVRSDQEIRFGKKVVVLSELLMEIDLVALVGARAARSVGYPLDGAVSLREVDQREWHERPRRNPETGDIEETP